MSEPAVGLPPTGGDGAEAPSAFMADSPVDLTQQVNQQLPGDTSGGPIESVKRAVVVALREAFTRTAMQISEDGIYIDLEYPLKEEQYPGIWVQFSLTKFVRGGIGHETVVFDPGLNQWTPIQVWTFEGRVTLSLVALKNKTRDQIADRIITEIAFSRTPEVWVTQPGQDTQQYRSLIAAINDNQYVSITLNTDMVMPGGQNMEIGVPWQPDTLAYVDSYAFDLIGQTQVKFRHDGAYTLARIDVNPTAVDSVPDQYAPPVPPGPPIGQGVGPNQIWRTL